MPTEERFILMRVRGWDGGKVVRVVTEDKRDHFHVELEIVQAKELDEKRGNELLPTPS